MSYRGSVVSTNYVNSGLGGCRNRDCPWPGQNRTLPPRAKSPENEGQRPDPKKGGGGGVPPKNRKNPKKPKKTENGGKNASSRAH